MPSPRSSKTQIYRPCHLAPGHLGTRLPGTKNEMSPHRDTCNTWISTVSSPCFSNRNLEYLCCAYYDEVLKAKILSNGLFTRMYTPQIMMQGIFRTNALLRARTRDSSSSSSPASASASSSGTGNSGDGEEDAGGDVDRAEHVHAHVGPTLTGVGADFSVDALTVTKGAAHGDATVTGKHN